MKHCINNMTDRCQIEVMTGCVMPSCETCSIFINTSDNIMETLRKETMERNIVRYSTPQLVAELRKRSEVRAIDVDGFYDEFFITTSKFVDEDEIEESGPATILIIK